MTLKISEMAEELKCSVDLQNLPVIMTSDDYEFFIRKAIKKLFVDTGRASAYKDELFAEDENGNAILNYDILIDEEEYIMLVAQIGFYKFVQNDKNNIVGYTTDALSITNADKPYANLKDTIEKLEKERRIVYYKMVRFALGVGV